MELPLRQNMKPADWCERCMMQVRLATSMSSLKRLNVQVNYKEEQLDLKQHGYCYLQVFKSELWDEMVVELGFNPTMQSIADVHVDKFDQMSLDLITVERITDDYYHFGYGNLSAKDIIDKLRDDNAHVVQHGCSDSEIETGFISDHYQYHVVHVDCAKADKLVWFDQPVFQVWLDGVYLPLVGYTDHLKVTGMGRHYLLTHSVGATIATSAMARADVNGLCYLKNVEANVRLKVYLSLGRYPTVADLLGSELLDDRVLASECGMVSEQVAHVVDRGKGFDELKYLPLDIMVGGLVDKELLSLFADLKDAVVAEKPDVLMVQIDSPSAHDYKARIGGSQVYNLQANTTDRVHARFKFTYYKLACAIFPAKVEVTIKGITYGKHGGRTIVFFKNQLEGTIRVIGCSGYTTVVVPVFSDKDADIGNLLESGNMCPSTQPKLDEFDTVVWRMPELPDLRAVDKHLGIGKQHYSSGIGWLEMDFSALIGASICDAMAIEYTEQPVNDGKRVLIVDKNSVDVFLKYIFPMPVSAYVRKAGKRFPEVDSHYGLGKGFPFD